METIITVAVILSVYYAVSKYIESKRNSHIEKYLTIPLDISYWSHHQFIFYIELWKIEYNRGHENTWFDDEYEVKRTGPMSWVWRHVGQKDRSAGSEVRLMLGVDFLAAKSAFERLSEHKEEWQKLRDTQVNSLIGFQPEGTEDATMPFIVKAGIGELWDKLVAEEMLKLGAWEEIPHKYMLQLENYYLACNKAA